MLKKGTVMREMNGHAPSTLDLIFAIQDTADQLIQCGVSKEYETGPDHKTTLTELNPTREVSPPRMIRSWDRMDHELFHKILNLHLPEPKQPKDKVEVDIQVAELTGATVAAINESTPLRPATGWITPGFSKTCEQAIAAAKGLRRR